MLGDFLKFIFSLHIPNRKFLMGSRKRKLKKVVDARVSRNVDNTQGSHLWSFNHYRINILTSLLNDIIDLENDGLEEDTCKIVRKSLDYFINASTNVPVGGFLSGKALYEEIESFANTYKEWNGIEGKTPEFVDQRRQIVKQLRRKRQGITNKVRRLQYELENHLDQKLLADSYTAIGEVIKLVPNVFNNLASSYGDYLKRSGNAE
jgi:hypothetical protein